MPTPPHPPIVTQQRTPNEWFYIRRVELHQLLAEIREAAIGWAVMAAVFMAISWGVTSMSEAAGWSSAYLESFLPDKQTRGMFALVFAAVFSVINFKTLGSKGVVGLVILWAVIMLLPPLPWWVFPVVVAAGGSFSHSASRLVQIGRENHEASLRHAGSGNMP